MAAHPSDQEGRTGTGASPEAQTVDRALVRFLDAVEAERPGILTIGAVSDARRELELALIELRSLGRRQSGVIGPLQEQLGGLMAEGRETRADGAN